MAHEPLAAPIAWLVVAATVVVSSMQGLFVLTSAEFDEASPVPGYQRWIAIAGIVAAAVAVALILYRAASTDGAGWFVAIVVLIGAFCAIPLAHQRSTVDVTSTGFHRATYRGYWFDLYVYNDTGAPIVIDAGTDARLPVRLRTPGRTVGPHDRVALTWPRDLYGTFTLTVTGPLPADARTSATVTRDRQKERVTV